MQEDHNAGRLGTSRNSYMVRGRYHQAFKCRCRVDNQISNQVFRDKFQAGDTI